MPAVLTLAIAVALLLQVPPDGVLLNDVVDPAQTLKLPDIAVGPGTKASDA